MRTIKYRVWVKLNAYPKDNKEVMLQVTGLEWDYQKGEHLVYVIGADPEGLPECGDALTGLAWTFGLTEDEYKPLVET